MMTQNNMRNIDKDNAQFHIGECIKPKAYNESHPIVDITENGYVLDIGMTIPFKDEDVWEVVEHEDLDLEKEIERYFDGWTDSPDYAQAINSEGECVSTKEIIDIVRHFYDLGFKAGEMNSNKIRGGYID